MRHMQCEEALLLLFQHSEASLSEKMHRLRVVGIALFGVLVAADEMPQRAPAEARGRGYRA